jgi:hypothetical protein
MNLAVIGGFSIILAIIAFLVYRYRSKHNIPLLKQDRDASESSQREALSKLIPLQDLQAYALGRNYPTICPCGCGLGWAADMPYPPHYTTPDVVRHKNQTHFDLPQQCKHKTKKDGVFCTCGHPHNYNDEE